MSVRPIWDDLPEMAGCYELKSAVDGKRYVGSSVNVRRRVQHHFYLMRKGKHRNRYLQRAYDKHGIENFAASLVCAMLDASPEELLRAEQELIAELRTADQAVGYNIHPTPLQGATAPSQSEMTRLREALAGRRRGVLSEDGREGQKDARARRWARPGEHEFAAESMAALWRDPDYRAKIGRSVQQRTLDPKALGEMRARMEVVRATSEIKRKANARASILRLRGHPPPECDGPLNDWIGAQYGSGVSARQIGLILGMAHNTVVRRLRDLGIEMPKRGQGRPKPATSAVRLAKCGITDLADFDSNIQVLYAEGHSVNALAKQCGVSSEAIRTSLHRSGSQIRGRAGRPSKIPRFA